MRVTLAISIVALTLAAWGGRIGLLTEGEASWWDWLRIGGSLAVGLFAAATLLIPILESARKSALVLFAVWSVLLWVRALIVNWAGSGAVPFKVIHTVLAIGFFALAVWAWTTATGSDSVPGPDEAHSQEQGQSKTAGLPES